MPTDESARFPETTVRPSRRSYLRSIAGSSTVILGIGSAAASPSDDSIEIVTTKRTTQDGDDITLNTKEVPRNWYNQITKAREVVREIKDEFLPADDIESIGIIPHEEAINGLRKHAIIIRLLGEESSKSIPDNRNNIPIEVRHNSRPPRWQTHDSCSGTNNYDIDYDPVKGGVIVESAYDSLSTCSGIGTTCCRTKIIGQSTQFMLTARHLWGCDSSDQTGQSAYQHGDYIGTVKHEYKSHDAVLIEYSSSGSRSGFSAEIVDDGDEVEGFETENQVASMISNSTDAERRGINSGQVSQAPTSYKNTRSACGLTLDDLIRYEVGSSGGGDSGGPYFVNRVDYNDGSDYNSLVGMHNGDNSDFTTWGVAAYALRYDHALNFT